MAESGLFAMCRQAYAPLVEAGYVEIVYGATKEGAFLSNHDLVKSIHLTGSTATYDAVVWGGKKKVGLASVASLEVRKRSTIVVTFVRILNIIVGADCA